MPPTEMGMVRYTMGSPTATSEKMRKSGRNQGGADSDGHEKEKVGMVRARSSKR